MHVTLEPKLAAYPDKENAPQEVLVIGHSTDLQTVVVMIKTKDMFMQIAVEKDDLKRGVELL